MRKFVRYVRKGWSCMSRFEKTISVLLGIASFSHVILFFCPNNQYLPPGYRNGRGSITSEYVR